MRRLHLLELHEQTWYPAPLRALFQSGLGTSLRIQDAFGGFVDPFRRFLERTRATAVLDLCSGSGEAAAVAWSRTLPELETQPKPRIVLSDLFPNRDSYRRLRARYGDWLDFVDRPIDATHPPPEAPPVRTMFNAFHHFRQADAQAILADAEANADGIAIYEITARTWKNMLQTLLVLPVASAVLTAFVLRPFQLRNLLFGLLIPIIPFTAVFDGIVSNLRTYTEDELGRMTRAIAGTRFEWEIGSVDVPRGGVRATYLFGWKKDLPDLEASPS